MGGRAEADRIGRWACSKNGTAGSTSILSLCSPGYCRIFTAAIASLAADLMNPLGSVFAVCSRAGRHLLVPMALRIERPSRRARSSLLSNCSIPRLQHRHQVGHLRRTQGFLPLGIAFSSRLFHSPRAAAASFANMACSASSSRS